MIENKIIDVRRGSIADELGIKENDILISINKEEVEDVIDYKYMISDEYVELRIKKTTGETYDYEIEKNIDEDLGIEFENPLMDKIKTCTNKCIFCFIDQLPSNLRQSLYVKDDDTRLSFLSGNYLTLTNLKDKDFDKIIKYGLSPLKVSVHSTNPEIRLKMLKNKKAGNIMEILEKFNGTNIKIDCQIVLCKDLNDGEELVKTIEDLKGLHPNIRSIAVVPVGLTKYREGLPKVKGFDKESAEEVLRVIEKFNRKYKNEIDTNFVFASDEFYILAKRHIPTYKYYEEFIQIENGVGMTRLFEHEVITGLQEEKISYDKNREVVVLTGELAYNNILDLSKKIIKKYNDLKLKVVKIRNEFFGEKITVSGLITGRDIINQLKGRYQNKNLIIPDNMLKFNEDVFLDDLRITDIEEELNSKIIVSKVDGRDFINKILGGYND
jgi:putative radical SAM enzyme (TIGR03279 family)